MSLFSHHTEIQTDPDDNLYFRKTLISPISVTGFWRHNIEVWGSHWNISTLKCWTWYPKLLEKTFLPSYSNQPAGKLLPYSATEKLIDAKGQWISMETFMGLQQGLWVSDTLEKCQNLSAVQLEIRYLRMRGFLVTSVKLGLNPLITFLSWLCQAPALYYS